MEVSVMMNSKLFWYAAGIASLWAFHAWIKPVPSAKQG